MDALIAGIVIVVVTGALVALVRKSAEKPLPKQTLGRMDAVDVDIAEGSLHRTLSDIAGSDPFDGDVGHW